VEQCFRDQSLRIRMIAVGVESLGRIDGALAVGFGEKAVRRGVMLLRHAGLKATPLRKGAWRVEVPGVDAGLEAGQHAAGMADKLLSVLEAGQPRQGEASAWPEEESPLAAKRNARKKSERRQFVSALPRPAPAPASEPETEVEEDPEYDPELDMDPELEPEEEAEAFSEFAEPLPVMEYFSSDMLDADEADEEPAPPKSTKKTKGKSGALARAKREALMAKREEAISGGARKVAKMPGISTKPGIINLSAGKKINPEALKPFKAKPATAAQAAKAVKKAEPVRDATGGVKVLGVEPYIADSQLGVVVPETAFNPIRSDVMTLVIRSEPPVRHVLKLAGMVSAPNGRVVLKLAVRTPEAVQTAAEQYLQAGAASLFDTAQE
jgi:hypothetical protein